MEVKGKILVIGETQEFGSNGFRKRELVIEVQGEYPQPIMVELHQDKVELLDSLSIGDEVTANINLRGKSWVSKEGVTRYFNTLQCWAIESETKDDQPF